jgi:hypothetical protein
MWSIVRDEQVVDRTSEARIVREGRVVVLKSVLREIVANARESGDPPSQALLEKAGIGPEVMQLAVEIQEETVQWWRHHLRWFAPHSQPLLEVIEILRELIVEKVQIASVSDPSGVHSTDPQLNDRYQGWLSAVETSVRRRAQHPERPTDKGYDAEPGYDGGASYDELLDAVDGTATDVAPKFWVRPTSLVAWPSKREIVTFAELRSAYRASLDWPKGRVNFPGEVTGEVSWWLRNHRPVLDRKIVFRNRTTVETWAKGQQQTLARLVAQAKATLDARPLVRFARPWIGELGLEVARHQEDGLASIVTQTRAKIARAKRNRIARPIGIVWLPGWIGGDVATAWLQDQVTTLNAQTGEQDPHWALQAFYDPESAEGTDGRPEVQPQIRQLLAKHGPRAPQVWAKAKACDFCG